MATPVRTVSAPISTAAPDSPATILLVEDDASVRQVLERWLRLKGFEVLSAANARAAQQIWREHSARISVLVTDVALPDGISGRELGCLLQGEKAELNVILTSGYNTDYAELEPVVTRRTQFLAKPYQPAELLAMVRAALNSAAQN